MINDIIVFGTSIIVDNIIYLFYWINFFFKLLLSKILLRKTVLFINIKNRDKQKFLIEYLLCYTIIHHKTENNMKES